MFKRRQFIICGSHDLISLRRREEETDTSLCFLLPLLRQHKMLLFFCLTDLCVPKISPLPPSAFNVTDAPAANFEGGLDGEGERALRDLFSSSSRHISDTHSAQQGFSRIHEKKFLLHVSYAVLCLRFPLFSLHFAPWPPAWQLFG